MEFETVPDSCDTSDVLPVDSFSNGLFENVAADSPHGSCNDSNDSSMGSSRSGSFPSSVRRTRSKNGAVQLAKNHKLMENGASGDLSEGLTSFPCEGCSIGQSDLTTPEPDHCNGGSTADERPNRRKGKRKSNTEESCPVCGVTVWLQELQSHYIHEVDKLAKIAKNLKKPCIEQPSINKSYELVKSNRENRLTAKVARYKKKLKNEIHCPVCDIKLSGTQDELTNHVVQCLKQQRNSDSDEDAVDVEGNGTYEEYEWAGQTRTRTVSLIEGGARALQGNIVKHRADDDDNQVLNVDSDDTLSYGQPQYSEHDVILLSSNANEDKERDQLRKAFLLDSDSQPHILETNKWSNTDVNSCEEQVDNLDHNDSNEVISCLREKIKDLEDQYQNDHAKCLICMEPYTKPVVSITCWHVYCEECWLTTMGVKKLCPQCNMIVFPSDLRRIYL